jgi:deferrochelatase/peroxidase EfeB
MGTGMGTGTGTAVAQVSQTRPYRPNLAQRERPSHSTAPTSRASSLRARSTCHSSSLDLTTSSRPALIGLMKSWTSASRNMATGRPVGRTGAVGGRPDAIPDDIGVALDLPASNLTITIGFGQSLFRTASRGGPIRPVQPAPGLLRRPAGLPRRPARQRDQPWRPVHPGLRR